MSLTENLFGRFYHHLDVEFVVDLMAHLKDVVTKFRDLCHSSKKPHVIRPYIQNRLEIIKCLATLTALAGETMNTDNKEAIIHLYRVLLDLYSQPHFVTAMTIEHYRIVILIIEKLFLVKRDFSYDTVASIILILLACVDKIKGQDNLIFIFLYTAKKLLQRYSKTRRMLEDDMEVFGNMTINVKIEDPQITNAMNTSIVPLLKRYEKELTVKNNLALIKRILKSEPLPGVMNSLSPSTMFEELFGKPEETEESENSPGKHLADIITNNNNGQMQEEENEDEDS